MSARDGLAGHPASRDAADPPDSVADDRPPRDMETAPDSRRALPDALADPETSAARILASPSTRPSPSPRGRRHDTKFLARATTAANAPWRDFIAGFRDAMGKAGLIRGGSNGRGCNPTVSAPFRRRLAHAINPRLCAGTPD
ncbi:hypothetical protein [Rubrimonas sp.]|uniref:hypothetical protein n=1 Tax=Rubrimonas sp. TaxID=2036015 RepID=UPI002FDDDCD1